MEEFKDWFEKKYLDWQNKRRHRGSLREFSEFLGLDQRFVSNLMNGDRKPGADTADRICIALGYDMTIYDVLGIPRPEKELLQVKALWPYMTEKERALVGEILREAQQQYDARAEGQLSRSRT